MKSHHVVVLVGDPISGQLSGVIVYPRAILKISAAVRTGLWPIIFPVAPIGKDHRGNYIWLCQIQA